MPCRAALPIHRRPATPWLGFLLVACLATAPPLLAEAVWQPLGPVGGDMAGLVQGPAGRLYAFTTGGELFASDDEAATWTRAGSLPESLGILVADAVEPGRLYLFVGHRSSPWRSDDGGATWLATEYEDAGELLDVEAVAEGGGTVLLDLREGYPEPDRLRRSEDGGATWVALGAGLPADGSLRGLAVAEGAPPTVWVTAAEGLFRSDDGGVSFTPVLGLPVGAVSAMAVASSDPRYLYAGFGDGRVARSFDGGAGWGLIARLPGDPEVVALEVDPNDRSNLTAVTSGGWWISTDAAVSWRRLEVGGEALIAGSLLFPAGEPGLLLTALHLYAAPSLPGGVVAGVLASRDAGLTWEPASRGLSAAPGVRVAVAPGEAVGPGAAESGEPAVLLSVSSRLLVGRPGEPGTSPAFSWDEPALHLPEGGDEGFPAVPAAAVPAVWPEHLFFETVPGSFESRDGGATWVERSAGLGCLRPGEPSVAPSDADAGYLWGDFVHRGCAQEDVCVLFRWRGADLACVAGTPRPNAARAVAVDARDADRAWALAGESELYRTEDGGAHWQRLADPPFVPTALAAHPYTAGRLLAGSVFGGIWRSDDGGGAWRRLRADDPSALAQRVEQILIDPVEPIHLVARIGWRALASDDDGRTWFRLDAGLPAAPSLRWLAVDPVSPSVLYAALFEGGAWRLERGRAPAPCVPNRRTLCLGEGGRFRVVLAGRDDQGRQRIGQTVRLDAAGAPYLGGFGIGPPPRFDALVQVVAGEDGAARVLWIALTANPFTVVVTDTVTGRSRGFRHAAGGAVSGGDPVAFPPS